MTSTTKYIDYLKEDEPIPGQLWVCISFLSPEGIKNCSVRGVKIRGIYGTRQEADNRADQLHKKDPDFHVFVGEVGKWLPWDPDPNDVKDQVYLEKELNDLMKGYNDNMEKSAIMQEQRKKDMISQAAREEQSRSRTAHEDKKSIRKERMKKTVLEKQNKDGLNAAELNAVALKTVSQPDGQPDSQSTEPFKQEDDQVNKALKRITSNQCEISTRENNLTSIDSKIEKIKELYEKLNKKP